MSTGRRPGPKPSLAPLRDGAATRARILKTAAEIFAAEGLAGARTDAIAATAGVNKALLYYYFKNKNDLYRAVLEDHFQEFSRHATEIFAAAESPGRALMRYVNYHFDFIGARPYYPRLIQRLLMAGGPRAERMVRKHMTPVGRMLRRLIDRGVRTGEFRAFDSRHTAISLVALVVFYFGTASLRRRGLEDPFRQANLARRKEEVLKFIRYALFRNPEAVAA